MCSIVLLYRSLVCLPMMVLPLPLRAPPLPRPPFFLFPAHCIPEPCSFAPTLLPAFLPQLLFPPDPTWCLQAPHAAAPARPLQHFTSLPPSLVFSVPPGPLRPQNAAPHARLLEHFQVTAVHPLYAIAGAKRGECHEW